LTGNMEMSRKIGLRSARRIPFFNGPIECRMLVFDLYEGSQREGDMNAEHRTPKEGIIDMPAARGAGINEEGNFLN